MTGPMLTGFAPAITFVENLVNSTPQLLDADVTFSNPSGNSGGGSLTLSGLLTEDRASVRNEGAGAGQIGLSGSGVTFGGVVIGTLAGGVGATLTITFNANATEAAIDALIQNLTYANLSDSPTTGRTLSLDVTDAVGVHLPPTPGAAVYAQLEGAANPFNGVDVGTESCPAFVDLDGDGDLDIVSGEYFGTIKSFQNNAGVYTELTGAANPFNGVDVGLFSRPSFGDLDNDGDLDAVIGEQDGTLRSYRNDGGVFSALIGAANPFNGVDVFYNAAPSFVDIDGDGDADAVVGTWGGTMVTFQNNAGVFTELTGGANPFNGILINQMVTPSFVDIDGDGDLDVVAGGFPGRLQVLQNDAGVFTNLTGATNPLNFVNTVYVSAPAVVDIDGDGDLDVVSGGNDGALFTYQNITPTGVVIDVTVTSVNDAPTLTGFAPAVTFAENLVNATPQPLALGTSFADAEGNFAGGSLTLSGLLAEDRASVRTVGGGVGQIALSGANVAFGGLNIGTLSGGVGTTLTITFNANATSAAIDALIHNLTYANVSNTPTATRTLVLDVTDAAGGTLNPAVDHFVELTGAANPFNAVDAGDLSTPVFVDLDQDGDLDLVVGAYDGTLRSYQNNAGAYTQLTGVANPFNGLDFGSRSNIGFFDIDGDGDLDAVVGESEGALVALRNVGGVFSLIDLASDPFATVDLGYSSAPTLVDFDHDGDLDVVAGANDGTITALQNTGGVFVELTGAANPFNGVAVSDESKPSLVDLDGDGDLDLVVGDYGGGLRSFRNDGATFSELTGANNPFAGVVTNGYAAPTFADIDGDGDLDAVVGDYNGDLQVFVNTTPLRPRIVVTITPQIEIINGTSGDNVLVGTADPDQINGLDGNDTITGGAGDTVHGGTGDDRLLAVGAGGFYYGDDGNDTLVRGTGISTLYGGSGIDLLDLRAYAGNYSVNMTMGLSSLATEIFNGFENIIMGNGSNIVGGTNVANTMTGGTNTDDLSGGDGNDILIGGAGNDTLKGDAGNDTLNGGTGIDRMIGGADNDTYVVDAAGDVIIEAAGAGTNDRVLANVSYALAAGVEVEVLAASNAALTTAINLNGNALAQTIAGNAGANVLASGTGVADRLYGYGGNDIYRVYNVGDLVFEAAGGGTDDRVIAYVNYTLAAGVAVEMLATSNAALTTAINLTGNALAQSLIGNAGANRLNGLGGVDALTGGAGADVFVFTAALAGNLDQITDYTVAADQIEIDSAIFAALPLGALAVTAFTANLSGAATTAAQRIIYETDTGLLWYDADGSGLGAGIRFADLAAGLTMTAAEFMVI
ncbi:MAG: FG-GAP-like repeat-containing protein [Paracoccaceae bacterium]